VKRKICACFSSARGVASLKGSAIEMTESLKGHGFSRAITRLKKRGALAPEETNGVRHLDLPFPNFLSSRPKRSEVQHLLAIFPLLRRKNSPQLDCEGCKQSNQSLTCYSSFALE